ncbi:MAG: PIN domain-containing protein [Gammaproteobacteria bacterium]|nr:PIN domain-containing protein [Gammaproteobacteria bacterium]
MSVDFLDTNIFIYTLDETDDRKSGIARQLVHSALRSGSAIISFQVVQETLNTITRKLPVPATPGQAGVFLTGTLIPLWKVNPSRELYRRGLQIQAVYQFAFYDSLIVAAALEAGCRTLFSEDLQHGQVIERLAVKNPFIT